MMVWKMYLLSNMAILGVYVRFQGVGDEILPSYGGIIL